MVAWSCHRNTCLPLFKKDCQSGISDLCYKCPCIFHRLNITVLEVYSLRVSVGQAEMESRDIWFTWRKPQLLFLTVQQHDLILGYSPSGTYFFPRETVHLHGMELNLLAPNCSLMTSRLCLLRGRINSGLDVNVGSKALFHIDSIKSPQITSVWLHNWYIWSIKSKGVPSLIARYLHSVTKFR